MADYIVRATAAGAAIRAFAITSRDLVETARQDHNTSPIMTAAPVSYTHLTLPTIA